MKKTYNEKILWILILSLVFASSLVILVPLSILIEAYFPQFDIIVSGIHEFGHSIAVVLTGGDLQAVIINFDNETGSFAQRRASTIYENGNEFIIATSGITFSLLAMSLLSKTMILRWFAPIIATMNVLRLLPYGTLDGYHIFISGGLISYSVIILLNGFILMFVVCTFVNENIITKNKMEKLYQILLKKMNKNICESTIIAT